jgi:hypothetical protein
MQAAARTSGCPDASTAALAASPKRHHMLGPFALVVGVVASIVMCIQNAGSLLGFGWELIHGAGPAAVIAFAPLGLGLGILWGGFRYLHRSSHRHASMLFTALALSTVLLYELLLPTPLRSWGTERAMQAAEVRNIRDEVLLSKRGNPIGVRLTYDVALPRAVVCHVQASGLHPSDGDHSLPNQFDFYHHTESIEPSPSSKDGFYREFKKGNVYRFTEALVPGFLKYDETTQAPCLNVTPYWEFSDADVIAAVKTRGKMQYRTSIALSSLDVPIRVSQYDYLTSHEYDLEAMYETVVKEGHKRCAGSPGRDVQRPALRVLPE